MKIVTAVIKPHKWEEVRTALEGVGVTAMTVSEVSGYGRQKGHTEVYRGAEYDVALVPRSGSRSCVMTPTSGCHRRDRRPARTGRIGDGKVCGVTRRQRRAGAHRRPRPVGPLR